MWSVFDLYFQGFALIFSILNFIIICSQQESELYTYTIMSACTCMLCSCTATEYAYNVTIVCHKIAK